jgi:hypothetical protein
MLAHAPAILLLPPACSVPALFVQCSRLLEFGSSWAGGVCGARTYHKLKYVLWCVGLLTESQTHMLLVSLDIAKRLGAARSSDGWELASCHIVGATTAC